jgi:predicted ABC-type ATPase
MKLFIITGTCGTGKSTTKDNLAARLDKGHYACVDSDEMGRNWRDYVGTEQKAKQKE